MSSALKTLEAIPTVYRGVKFRSRLEARWAVFFDTLGVPWEYEPDRFRLPSDQTYLPDFCLGNDVLVEIKPNRENEDVEASRAKLAQLTELGRCIGLLVCGHPGVNTYSIEAFDSRDGGWIQGRAWRFGRGRKETRDAYILSDSAGASCFHEYDGTDRWAGEEKWPLECGEEDFAPSREHRFA